MTAVLEGIQIVAGRRWWRRCCVLLQRHELKIARGSGKNQDYDFPRRLQIGLMACKEVSTLNCPIEDHHRMVDRGSI